MSGIGKRCHEARDVAETLGHKLLGFRFRYGQGATTCQTCGGTGLVSDELIGVAFTMPCKRGEPFPEVPATSAPPSGKAKRAPRPTPMPATPATDDVPWFMRDKVPAAVRS